MKDKEKAMFFGVGLARQVLDALDTEMAKQQEEQKRRKAPISWVFLPLLGAGAAIGVMRRKAGKRVVPKPVMDKARDVATAATELVKEKVLDHDGAPKAPAQPKAKKAPARPKAKKAPARPKGKQKKS